jgi:excisionase family DNA binding protein
MSDATDRVLLGCKRLVDAYTQQHESDAEAARAYAEDILRSDPLALTVAEAARRLSVSVSTIRAMIADERLPCIRLVVGRKGSRGRVLVRTADVDALLRDPPVPCATGPQMCACTGETGCRYSHVMQPGTLARARAEEETFLPVRKSSKKSKGGCHD